MTLTLEFLLDHHEICRLLDRYGLALDDRDWPRFASCFLPDAVAFYGPVLGRQDGYAAIEKTCRSALERLDSSQHMISNHEVVLDGDTARARCYLQAQHTKAGTPGGDNFLIGGRYIDEIARTPEGWRVRRRELQILWQEGNPDVLGAA